ncbi:hypothetical protein BAE44_0002203, partial [Dichanthelium oligosanthes]
LVRGHGRRLRARPRTPHPGALHRHVRAPPRRRGRRRARGDLRGHPHPPAPASGFGLLPAAVPRERHRRGVPQRRVVVGHRPLRARHPGHRRLRHRRVPPHPRGDPVPAPPRPPPPRLRRRGLGPLAGRHGGPPQARAQGLYGRGEGRGEEGPAGLRPVLVRRHGRQGRRRPQLRRRVLRSGGGRGRRAGEGHRVPALELHQAGRGARAPGERVPAGARRCRRGLLRWGVVAGSGAQGCWGG